MLTCINPGCFQGDPSGPPEYQSTNPGRCSACGEEIDLDDEPYAWRDGEKICEHCRQRCSECGEICGEDDAPQMAVFDRKVFCVPCIALAMGEEG